MLNNLPLWKNVSQLGRAHGPNLWHEKVCDRQGSFQHPLPIFHEYLIIIPQKFLMKNTIIRICMVFTKVAIKHDDKGRFSTVRIEYKATILGKDKW